jgi:hypothetical protein
VRFEVKVMNIKSMILWKVTPCSLTDSKAATAFIFRVCELYPEDGSRKFLRNLGKYLPGYTESYPRI